MGPLLPTGRVLAASVLALALRLGQRVRRNRRNVAVAAVIGFSLPLLLFASLATWLLFLRIIWVAIDGPLPSGPIATGPQATLVFDRGDAPVFSFSAEQRVDVPLDQVSPHLIAAVLAAEDRRFFSHHGLDPIRIAGAALRNYRAGRIVQGASTITQQLVRAVHLGQQRTWRRKFREALLATDLETRLSKREILQHYLNTIYFGDGFYGIEAAARGYFGKSAARLNVEESALLAGLIRSPAQSPSAAPARARSRRNAVLRAMLASRSIDKPSYRRASAAPLETVTRDHFGAAMAPAEEAALCGMYFFEEVRRELVALFGEERVMRDGLRVYTTLDADLQRAAENTIRTRIATLGRKRALLARELQGALVSIDAKTGEVRAIVGGRDFHRSSFNRAVQARRQPGSAFKPIVFAAALERGFGPGSLLRDLETPIQAAEGDWLPGGEHEASEYTLRRALKVSSNRASAQLLQQIGVRPVIDYARKMGIRSDLPEVPSLALGTGGVTLLELVSAYVPFANEGLWVRPTIVRRVEDRHGDVLWQAPRESRQAIGPATAYLMSSMLRDVVRGGTAYVARSMGFKHAAAGKTGTTDDYADAWFVGYTPRLVTGVWFGFDRPRTIFQGGFAGTVAVPAWTRFMLKATAADPDEWYSQPRGVEAVTICRLSGAIATDSCKRDVSYVAAGLLADGAPPPEPEPPTYTDLFAIGTGPTEDCPLHSSAPPGAIGAGGAMQPASYIRR